MIRLPSVVQVMESARETAQRFPWVLLSAIVSACLSWFLVVPSSLSPPREELLSRSLLISVLGISIFFALRIGLERSSGGMQRQWIGLAAGIAILAALFLSYHPDTPQIYCYRFLQLAVASHLLVAVAPYWRREEVAAFWQFNRILFERILQSALFSGVLYVGLTVALKAIQSLLGLNVEWKIYYFLFLAIGYLFNTWFFLAGVPSNWGDLEKVENYPPILRLFVQFILLPLITLYILILYAYLIKIIAIREWPRGTIGWLVSVVSVFGMLSLLLVHPLRNRPGHRWIHLFSRSFYAGLFPLIVLLLMAIWRRVSEYGLTEDRYFLVVLSVWMILMSGYFTFWHQPSIKMIPFSLALVALLTLGGPWGPYAVCLKNQQTRLREILQRVEILKEGHIQKTHTTLDFKDRKEISALVTYLLEMHGIASLQSWFTQDLKALQTDSAKQTRRNVFSFRDSNDMAAKLTNLMGVPYVNRWQARIDSKDFYVNSKRQWQEARSIAGYDYLVQVSLYKARASTSLHKINVGQRQFDLFWATEGTLLELRESDRSLIRLELTPFLERIVKETAEGPNGLLPEEFLSLEGESDSVKIKILFDNVSGTREPSGPQLTSANGALLLRLKDQAR